MVSLCVYPLSIAKGNRLFGNWWDPLWYLLIIRLDYGQLDPLIGYETGPTYRIWCTSNYRLAWDPDNSRGLHFTYSAKNSAVSPHWLTNSGICQYSILKCILLNYNIKISWVSGELYKHTHIYSPYLVVFSIKIAPYSKAHKCILALFTMDARVSQCMQGSLTHSVLSRHSTRKFLPTTVPIEHVKESLSIAQH